MGILPDRQDRNTFFHKGKYRRENDMHKRENLIHRGIVILLVVLLTVSMGIVLKGWFNGSFRSVDSLRSYIETFGMWGPLVLTMIQALKVIVSVIPGFLGCIVGAAMFGATVGFWANYIGLCAGSIASFYLARHYGRALVCKMVPMEKYEKFVQWMSKQNSYTLVLFISILSPIAPDDFLCYFSGLIHMKPRKFIWIILTAKPWCILFYSIFFAWFL